MPQRALQRVEVDDAKASTQHYVGIQLILHSQPWLEVIPIARIVISVRRTGKLQAAIERKTRNGGLQRVRARRAESVVQPVVAFGKWRLIVPANAHVDRQVPHDAPVVLRVNAIVELLKRIGDLIAIRPARRIAQQ